MIFPLPFNEKLNIEKRMPEMHLIGYIGLFFSLWTIYVFFIQLL